MENEIYRIIGAVEIHWNRALALLFRRFAYDSEIKFVYIHA